LVGFPELVHGAGVGHLESVAAKVLKLLFLLGLVGAGHECLENLIKALNGTGKKEIVY
jgi:hypothetical protein